MGKRSIDYIQSNERIVKELKATLEQAFGTNNVLDFVDFITKFAKDNEIEDYRKIKLRLPCGVKTRKQ